MTQGTSPSVQRRYSPTMVCHLWFLSRATMDRQRPARVAQGPRPPGRRGLRRIHSDADLPVAIREVIEASFFAGEGYPQGLGAAALSRHPDGRAPGAADHEGAWPAGAPPASVAGGASA